MSKGSGGAGRLVGLRFAGSGPLVYGTGLIVVGLLWLLIQPGEAKRSLVFLIVGAVFVLVGLAMYVHSTRSPGRND